MLVLSILIILALAVAVASFFIENAEWLLLVPAALVLVAFYLSRRPARGRLEASSTIDEPGRRPAREHLRVIIDPRIIRAGSGRHRDSAESAAPAESDFEIDQALAG